MSVISSQQIEPRSYFLIELQTPEIIWAIRIIGILVFLIALCIYIYMKKKHKDGE